MDLKVILKGPKKVKFGYYVTFANFRKRSFSRSERSGLDHFSIIIDIIQ